MSLEDLNKRRLERANEEKNEADINWRLSKEKRAKEGLESHDDWYDVANEILLVWLANPKLSVEAKAKLKKLWVSVCLLHGEAANSQEWKVHEKFYNSMLSDAQGKFKALKNKYHDAKTKALKLQKELDIQQQEIQALQRELKYYKSEKE